MIYFVYYDNYYSYNIFRFITNFEDSQGYLDFTVLREETRKTLRDRGLQCIP